MKLLNLFGIKSKKQIAEEKNEEGYRLTQEAYQKARKQRLDTEKEGAVVLKFRNKAQKLEKEMQITLAIKNYLKSVNYAEQSKWLNITNFAYDIDRIIILYGKLKDKNSQISFLERVIETYNDYRDSDKWKVRLSKLKKINITTKIDLQPKDIEKQKAGKLTKGKEIQEFKKTLKEFNFYYDKPENIETFEYKHKNGLLSTEQSFKLKNYRDDFKVAINNAKIAENENDLKTAIEIYEKLVVEEYDEKEPYERLIVIYRKLKWREVEIKTLEKAIKFFRKNKRRQKKYVLEVAEKYGMTKKANEYIKKDKKIQYYLGVFDLYNPYTVIIKWTDRLKKIQEK